MKNDYEPSNEKSNNEGNQDAASGPLTDSSRRAFVRKSLAAGIVAAQPSILSGLIRADGGGGETTTNNWGTTQAPGQTTEPYTTYPYTTQPQTTYPVTTYVTTAPSELWAMLCSAPELPSVSLQEFPVVFAAGNGNSELSATLVLEISTSKIKDPDGTLPYLYVEFSDFIDAYVKDINGDVLVDFSTHWNYAVSCDAYTGILGADHGEPDLPAIDLPGSYVPPLLPTHEGSGGTGGTTLPGAEDFLMLGGESKDFEINGKNYTIWLFSHGYITGQGQHILGTHTYGSVAIEDDGPGTDPIALLGGGPMAPSFGLSHFFYANLLNSI